MVATEQQPITDFSNLSPEEIVALLDARRKELNTLNNLASERGISKNAQRKNGALIRGVQRVGRLEATIERDREQLRLATQERDDLIANYLKSRNIEELPAELQQEITEAYEAAKVLPEPKAKTKKTAPATDGEAPEAAEPAAE